MKSERLKAWDERRGIGRIAEVYPSNAKGLLHVHASNGEKRYALRFFVGDCKGFAPRTGDEVSFVFRSFRAMDIRKLDGPMATVITLDLGVIV